jgi:hypothetical protein
MTDRNSKILRLRALIQRFDEQQRQDFLEELRQFLNEQAVPQPQRGHQSKRSKTKVQVNAATQTDFDAGQPTSKFPPEDVALVSYTITRASEFSGKQRVSDLASSEQVHHPVQADACGTASSAQGQRTHYPRSRLPLLEELLPRTCSLPSVEE